MQIQWLADTTLGAMLGDYISVSYVTRTRRPGARTRRPADDDGLQRVDFHVQAQDTAAAHACRNQLTVSTSVALTNAMRWLNEIS